MEALRATFRPVMASNITSQERDRKSATYGVCWNTMDDFRGDYQNDPDILAVIYFHDGIASQSNVGHWYLPSHPTLKWKPFTSEVEAWKAASASHL